jgi:hypothetical protein
MLSMHDFVLDLDVVHVLCHLSTASQVFLPSQKRKISHMIDNEKIFNHKRDVDQEELSIIVGLLIGTLSFLFTHLSLSLPLCRR